MRAKMHTPVSMPLQSRAMLENTGNNTDSSVDVQATTGMYQNFGGMQEVIHTPFKRTHWNCITNLLLL